MLKFLRRVMQLRRRIIKKKREENIEYDEQMD